MSLGLSPLGLTPLGLSHEFKHEFNLSDRPNQGNVIQTASFVELALIRELHQHPELLKTINRRKFEELVAELFDGFGYEVELTQKTRDGGKDIIAIKRREVAVKYLIECKRPDPGNPVSVSTVRALHGVRDDERATKAILVTTTHFSKDAEAFAARHEWQLELKEYQAIKSWLADYLTLRS